MNHTQLKLTLACAAFLASSATSALEVTDRNSSLGVNERNGITTWFVDGRPDNVFLSNYYLRLDDAGMESPLSELLGDPDVTSQGNTLTLEFSGEALSATLDYTLVGGAPSSGASGFSKSLHLTNVGDDALLLNLFDYSDFDIKFDQLAQADQTEIVGPGALVTRSATVPYALSTVVTGPDRYEVGSFFDLYTKFFLDQDGATVLTNTPMVGAIFPEPASDNAFAFQWTRTLAPGQSFAVNHTSALAPVPVPAALPLFAGGLFALLRSAGRRRGLSGMTALTSNRG